MMTMIGLLFLATMQAAPASVPPIIERRAVPEARLDIPDEIAPAIMPYMRCLAASRGVPIRAPGHGAVEPPSAAVGADCTPVRAEAARNAETMLAAQHRGNPQERAALIERTLAGVDGFANMSSAPAQAQPDAATLAQAVDRCMTTYAVRLTRTEAADEAIFAEATQGCGALSEQLHLAIAREYGAGQARELVATIAATARPNFIALLQRIRTDRQNRAGN